MATLQQQAKIVFKGVKDLVYDPENPRLPMSVDGRDEKQVINWMLDNENVIELMASIAEEGFFPAEPLLVAPSKKRGKFEVVEGNRRLTAVKLLLNPELATGKKNAIKEIIDEGKEIDSLTELPVIVFENSSEIQQYLGYRHITGVQPWDSLAKARYLRRMQKTLKIKKITDLYKALAKMIGSRSNHVKLLLTGLDIYETIEENSFFGIEDLDEKSIKFGVLYTAIDKPNIAYFIGIDLEEDLPAKKVNKATLKELTKWMFEKNKDGFTRIGESRNLRLLSKILDEENSKALAAFRKGKSLQDAVLLTDEPHDIVRASLSDAYKKLETTMDYIHLIDNPEKADIETASEIVKLSRTITTALRTKNQMDDDI